MESLRQLGRCIEDASSVLEKAEEESDDELDVQHDHDVDEFRSSITNLLEDSSEKLQEVDPLCDAASARTAGSRKLVSDLKTLLESRQKRLAQYGFKPTIFNFQRYPDQPQSNNAQKNASMASQAACTDQPSYNTPSKMTRDLVAKYTPAKPKLVSPDPGEETYVISKSRPNTGVTGITSLLSKYTEPPAIVPMATEKVHNSKCNTESLAKRMEKRYWVAPASVPVASAPQQIVNKESCLSSMSKYVSQSVTETGSSSFQESSTSSSINRPKIQEGTGKCHVELRGLENDVLPALCENKFPERPCLSNLLSKYAGKDTSKEESYSSSTPNVPEYQTSMESFEKEIESSRDNTLSSCVKANSASISPNTSTEDEFVPVSVQRGSVLASNILSPVSTVIKSDNFSPKRPKIKGFHDTDISTPVQFVNLKQDRKRISPESVPLFNPKEAIQSSETVLKKVIKEPVPELPSVAQKENNPVEEDRIERIRAKYCS